ncbi:MAG: 5-formyltetrahydrofolate cyclo-ligase [Coprobacter sp.]|nr:5-formyltetrahydrofolate cyclo-ligase [Coprobacter sp.]
MNKKELREEIKKRKTDLTPEQKRVEARDVFSVVETTPEFRQARRVLLYHSLPDELSTIEFISAWHREKEIYLPYIDGDFIGIGKYIPGELQKGKFGIPEPCRPQNGTTPAIDIAIVPGVAFDRQGNRLGRGKGYYDRLFHRLDCYKIGVCYRFQLLESIPAEVHDCRMDMVIAPGNIIKPQLN